MTLSNRDDVALSAMDEELSRDPVLLAVAGLFAQSPPRRREPHRVPARHVPLLARIPYPYAILSVIAVVIGVLCCGVAAAAHLPDAATAAAALSVCAAMVFVVVVIARRSVAATAPALHP